MFDDVHEQLAERPEEKRLQFVDHRVGQSPVFIGDLESVFIVQLLGKPVDGRTEPKLVQNRSAEFECQRPRHADRFVDGVKDV
ncbi:hypothetical protein SDC9_197112 [bioreactor metagenome]|uniref:Uncharacterized protein n=1 Tax=bioreactor metagenome TaxID=1076179 RepID=A0A645IDS9_9ZZZZ